MRLERLKLWSVNGISSNNHRILTKKPDVVNIYTMEDMYEYTAEYIIDIFREKVCRGMVYDNFF